MTRLLAFLPLLSLLPGAVLPAQSTGADARPLAVVGGTVIDGTGSEPISDGVVIAVDGRIHCVGTRQACTVPDDARVLDARDRWVTPGLVDAHVHYSQTGWADGRPDAYDARDRFPYAETVVELEEHPERFYRAALCSGVTATFDVGGFPWTWDLREEGVGSPDRPHVAAAGPLLSTRDHWVELPAEEQFLHVETAEATEEAARYLVANRTDAVKVWYLVGETSPDTAHYKRMLRIGARHARDADIPLIVHATGLWQAKDALRAGARVLVHSVEDRPVDDEFLRLAREAGAFYIPTLTVLEGYRQLAARDFAEDRYRMECVDPATRRKAFLTDSLPGGASAEARERQERTLAEQHRLRLRNLRAVRDAGIPVAMGTDAGNPLTLHGPSVYMEMEAMVEAGLDPMEVIVASTRNGARAMGRGDDLGILAPGRVADLLVLAEDPLRDVGSFRSVVTVVRGGVPHAVADLEFPPG